jgi:hypothetical protein
MNEMCPSALVNRTSHHSVRSDQSIGADILLRQEPDDEEDEEDEEEEGDDKEDDDGDDEEDDGYSV